MAALSAIRCNPAARALYARVVAKHPLLQIGPPRLFQRTS
jgi:hypothetical protein